MDPVCFLAELDQNCLLHFYPESLSCHRTRNASKPFTQFTKCLEIIVVVT